MDASSGAAACLAQSGSNGLAPRDLDQSSPHADALLAGRLGADGGERGGAACSNLGPRRHSGRQGEVAHDLVAPPIGPQVGGHQRADPPDALVVLDFPRGDTQAQDGE